MPNWSACFLGGIQPGPIQRIAKDTSDDGLLQRFTFIVPGPQQSGVDRAPDAIAAARYSALFPALGALRPPRFLSGDGHQAVAFHADAHPHRERVFSMAEAMAAMPDTSGRMQSAFGKWPGLYSRLALVFHLIGLADARARNEMGEGHPQIISEDTARRAADFLVDIALPHLHRAESIMYATTQTGHAKWIAGFILSRKLDRISMRDVVRNYRDLKPPECEAERERVMASLVTVGWLEPEPPSSPAKPVSSWVVNPAVHVIFGEQAKREADRRERAKERLSEAFDAIRAQRESRR